MFQERNTHGVATNVYLRKTSEKPEKTWSTNSKWKVRELYLRTRKVLAPHASVTRDDSLESNVPIWLQFIFFSLFTFLYLFYAFLYFYLFVVDEGVSLAPTYSSIVIRKSDLRSSFVNKAFWLSYFFILFCKICFYWMKGHLRRWTIKQSFDSFWKERKH